MLTISLEICPNKMRFQNGNSNAHVSKHLNQVLRIQIKSYATYQYIFLPEEIVSYVPPFVV